MRMMPTVKVLVCVLAASSVWAQSPSIIQNTRNTMNAVSNNNTAASNQALGINQSEPAVATRPSHAAAHASVKTSAAAGAPKKASAPAAKTVAAPAKVSVVAVHANLKPKPAVAAPKNNPAHAETAAVKGSPAPSAPVAASAKEENGENEASLAPDPKYGANGRRDPFISPVVSHAGAAACSSGKKCLEIGTVNLRGVVHGQSGFIAVVSNGLNKAYFLRENDPVFNGYVVKITGDSIVFQETLQDRLGKSFTREVVKKITTPAV
jgi:hypothetical protein